MIFILILIMHMCRPVSVRSTLTLIFICCLIRFNIYSLKNSRFPPSSGADPNHEGSLSEGAAFLLLCWHDLPWLYLLWMDCTGAVPREGNFLTGFEEITVMGVTEMQGNSPGFFFFFLMKCCWRCRYWIKELAKVHIF